MTIRILDPDSLTLDPRDPGSGILDPESFWILIRDPGFGMGLKKFGSGSRIRNTGPYEKLLIRIRQAQKLKYPTEAAVQKISDPDPGSPKLGSLGLRSGTLVGGNVS